MIGPMAFAILEELQTYGPDRCERLSYEQATDYTRRLTRTHYENFTVVSWFLPRRLRDDFSHIYAFCRWADDLGDEIGDPVKSVRLLEWWRRELQRCYDGKPRHPVFVALEQTVRRHDIPMKPFDDLICAFVQDQQVARYATWDQVLDYCTRSANPVGRLVLYLCGHRDEPRQRLADQTCTALQLANFWQDVRRDILERDRVYLPSDVASQHGLSIEQMVRAVEADSGAQRGVQCAACPDSVAMTALRPAFRATCRDLVGRTWPMFRAGRELWPRLASDVRLDVKLFTLGGEAILKRIERLDHDTLTRRPRLGKGTKLWLILRGFAGKLSG
jgi:squalene synthase HpnC